MSVPGWISALSDNDARQTSIEIGPVLSAATERVHYAEGRRGQYAAIAAGLFAGAIALAAVSGQENLESISWALNLAAIGFFTLSSILFYVYSKQVNRYPWTSATTTWKWFYRDAIPEQEKFDLGFFAWLFRWKREVVRAKDEFNRQLPLFGDALAAVTDPKLSLWQDVQQLYVLHVNEKYKNMYLSQLRSILTGGLVVVSSLVLVAILAQLLIDTPRNVIRAHFNAASTRVEMAAAKYAGSDCRSDCWIVNLSARNYAVHAIGVGVIAAGDCFVLPSKTGSSMTIVPPRSRVTSAMYFICRDVADLRRWEIVVSDHAR